MTGRTFDAFEIILRPLLRSVAFAVASFRYFVDGEKRAVTLTIPGIG
jgi:hypothetical protein